MSLRFEKFRLLQQTPKDNEYNTQLVFVLIAIFFCLSSCALFCCVRFCCEEGETRGQTLIFRQRSRLASNPSLPGDQRDNNDIILVPRSLISPFRRPSAQELEVEIDGTSSFSLTGTAVGTISDDDSTLIKKKSSWLPFLYSGVTRRTSLSTI